MQKPGLFGINGLIILFLIFLSAIAHGQQTGYLILIDAENKQAFTVRIGDEFYSSSAHGHLVLSRLKDSSYLLNLRFPKKNLAEQIFPVTVRQKDLGFQLKEIDSTWELYNWQTKETIHPVKEKDSSRMLDQGVKKEDGFSRLMAAVVNDTTVMYNTYSGRLFSRDTALQARSLKPKAQNLMDSSLTRSPLPTLAKVKTDESKLKPDTDKVNSNIVQPSTVSHQPSTVNRQPPTLQPSIKKLREVSLKISRKIVFLDIGKDGQKDTITLFVYYETADTAGKKQASALSVPVIKKPLKPDSLTAIAVATKNKPDLKATESGCGELATDTDVGFLRNAILKANTEHDKIALASSAFLLKCFSVNQIRLLAGLFVSDKAKYKLMDVARQHIADRDHFRELADMYTDKNFQRKFLQMADKRT